MIPVLLRDLLPRFGLVLVAGIAFYFLEPGFHPHDHPGAELDPEMGPLGLSATLGNLATLVMLILLADTIAGDRRRGFARIYFSHPTSPFAFYGLRWIVAFLAAMMMSALFLVIGQWIAWGEFRGGWEGMTIAFAAAVSFGGLVIGLSALLPRGDAWAAAGAYVATLVWQQILALGMEPFYPGVRQAITLLLPPIAAIQEHYEGIVTGDPAWDAFAYVIGYGVAWMLVAALAVRLRDW